MALGNRKVHYINILEATQGNTSAHGLTFQNQTEIHDCQNGCQVVSRTVTLVSRRHAIKISDFRLLQTPAM